MSCSNQFFGWIRCSAAATMVTALVSSAALGGSVIYVDDDAPGGGDGASWDTAYRFLQEILAGAAAGTEIRVAQGVYLPDHNEANPGGTGDREISFELNSGVTVFGGYAGIGAEDPDARDIELYETILSGDLLGDDLPGFVNLGDNSNNVVTASLFTDNTALIDGLTICCGFALNPGEGGGFNNLGGSPVIENCTFRTNFADDGGGGFFSSAEGSPTLHDCLFENNFANGWGGGIWIQIGTAEIVGCTFVDNTGNWGGGLAVFGNGNFEIVDVLDSTFMTNTATQGGGGIFVDGADKFTISNCLFQENDASSNPGGGGGVITGTVTTITDCEFVANTSFGSGGGLLLGGNLGGGTDTITNCSFIGNVAQQLGGGGVAIHSGGANGVYRFDDCTFVQNETAGDGGALLERFAALEVIRGLFVANSSTGAGGALELEEGNPVIVSSAFFGNAAGSSGGAVHDDEASPLLINCLISGNTSQASGGALSSFLSDPVILDSSIVANQASDVGGGIRNFNGNPIIANSILWANEDSTGVNETSQITDLQGGVSTVNYSCIEGLTGDLGGVGNIGDDPLFVDSDGPDDIVGTDDDDLHLQIDSPCINVGDNALLPLDVFDLDGDGDDTEPLPHDIEGNDRVIAKTVDMGSYEMQGVPPGEYIGPKGGSWFDPNNWEGGSVPDETTDVFLSTLVAIDQPGAVAASVTIRKGGNLSIGAGSLFTLFLFVQDGGTLSLTAPAAVLDVQTLTVNPGGAINWTAGTINLTGGTWTHSGSLLIGCDGVATLNLSDGATVIALQIQICSNGLINGNGTLESNVLNNGQISPGFSAGSLNVSGSFEQGPSGILAINIDGFGMAEHDRLEVEESAILGGTLNVSAMKDLDPRPAQFQVITAGSVAGTFDITNLPDPIGEFEFSLAQDSTSVSILLISNVPQGSIIYVNAVASDFGTGTSWANALNDLQDALVAVEESGGLITDVWVATGTYIPSNQTDPNDPRTLTFQLLSGATIYGGFAGGEKNLEERDIVNNVTILSGDINGDDLPDFGNNEENAYHVAIGSGVDATAVLDGFRIQGGNANNDAMNFTRRGGALYNEGGSPTIRNNTFTSNWANGEGGALFNGLGSSPTVENCSFLGNTGSAGGAIGNVGNSSPVVTNCMFDGNFGGLSGGAMANIDSSSPTISDSTFANNSSDEVGGAISNGFECNPSISGCLFDGNASSIEGGAIFSQLGDPFLSGCTFVNNLIGIRGGAVYNEQNSATFVSCRFIGNVSESRGGAVYNDAGSDATLIQCYFTGNYALRYGGAIYNNANLMTITNSTLSANVADFFEGGGIFNNGGAPSIFANCILWGNTSNFGLVDEDAQIGTGNITVNYSCIQGLTGNLGGAGNIGDDPRFVDADGPDNTAGTLDDNLQLFFGSPCIDAGSNFEVPADLADLDDDGDTREPLPFDLAGNDRFVDDPLTADTGAGDPPIVDMGPYEFGPVCPGCPGPRLWIDPTGGSYNDPANWHPDLPAETDSVIFDLSSSYTVTFSIDATNDSLVVTNGDVTLALNGNLYDLTNAAQETLHIGMLPGSPASLTLDGGTMLAPSARVGGDPGSSGELAIDSAELIIADAVNIGELSFGSLVLSNGAVVNTGAGVIVHGQGEVSGDGAILGNLTNFGIAVPGAGDHGVLVINGNYQQLDSTSTLRIGLGGSIPGVEFDVLEVNGEATLGGRLVVTADPDFEPQLGESFTIVTADSILGEFDIAFLPPVIGDLVLTIQYDDGGKGGPASVTLVVEELDVDFFTFDDPLFFGDFLPPTDAMLLDVNNDGFLDVVLTIPAPDKGGPNDPGSIVVFLNLGVKGNGQWNGFDPVPAETLVQEQPVSVAAGFFNDDEHVDLTVANVQFGRISVLLNNGAGDGSFTEHQVFDVDNGARSVAAGPLYGNSVDDLVVLTSVLSRQRFFGNDGSGTFSLVQTVNGAGFDGHITTLDADGDGDPEVISAGTTGVNVTFRNDQSGLFGPGGDHYPVTEGTIDLRTADLDDSGFGDIMTINEAAGLVSVLLNLSDGTGVMAPAIDLQVGNAPSSLATVDIDADGDLDLAVAAENEFGERVVRLKRNELIDGQLGFTDTSPLPVNGLARIVLAGDLNGDSRPDLIAINDETAILAGGVVGSSMSVHVNATGAIPCPWDIDGSGSVGAADLLSLLASWGPCKGCPADFDRDGNVGASDLLALLANWGPCP